ncbi:cytochrome P450 [Paractinoplanes ferrugineus]|uniref:Cytochrome P450 hydroxylase n=1 Tax=Paractinoplanes ferrugineus TaxID=113564 RepID=A0A919J551_9ACTN|nr:cytochrome P450 [Actinoplanes ferrugineus]GIE12744.1 cytochrome P450 hydroxylase [Actinoplanes ferrugineus]
MAVIELAALGPDFIENPFPYYAKWRADGPVHELRAGDGGRSWIVVDYGEGRSALADPRLSKSRSTAGLAERFVDGHLLVVDPPDHTRLRRLVGRDFTPHRVEALGPRIQQLVDGLLDAAMPEGRADLVDALAFPLSMTILCDLLGVPESDSEDFRRWTIDMLAPADPAVAMAGSRALHDYLGRLIESRRGAAEGPDLVSALLRTAEQDRDRLSESEVRAMAFLLVLAGHETSVNMVANGIRALLAHPDQLALLRSDMSLLDSAIEEMLRFEGSVETSTKRYAREPVELGGVSVPAGGLVVVSLLSANRDDRRFEDADRFDITRASGGAGRHLAFGHGIHFCLGAPLARLEARITIGTLLRRCPDLRLDPDAEPLRFFPGLVMRGVRHLPVRW